MSKYKIKITYVISDIQPEIIEIETNDIEWSMAQYQRNRDTFNWEIISE